MRDSPVVCGGGGGVAMQQFSYETDLRDRTNSLAERCEPVSPGRVVNIHET